MIKSSKNLSRTTIQYKEEIFLHSTSVHTGEAMYLV